MTDQGAADVRKIASLETLDLGGTTISPAGLKTLKDLPALKTLELVNTKIGAEGLAVFQNPMHFRALEKLRIEWDPAMEKEFGLLVKARPRLKVIVHGKKSR